MSIFAENLIRLEHKQGEMIDNLWILFIISPYSSPLWGANDCNPALWAGAVPIQQRTVAPFGGANDCNLTMGYN